MAFQTKISLSNAILEEVVALFPAGAILEIYAGTQPTNADTAISGQTLLASITLPATPWGSASARAIAKNGTWQDASANGGSATAPTFARLKDSGDTHRIDMTAGVGSGDCSVDGSITAGQVVTVTAFTLNGPS
jgi:hypothetical protein